MEYSKDKYARRAVANFYEPRGNSPSSTGITALSPGKWQIVQ